MFSLKTDDALRALIQSQIMLSWRNMKKDIHPKDYRPVIFEDSTSGRRFLIVSTVATTKTDTWENGKEYPLYTVEISSASHPFYTGKATIVDTAGRIERFKSRTAAAKAKKDASAGKKKGAAK